MITVTLVPEPNNEIRALVGALEQELATEYSPEQRHGLSLDAIFQPHVRFFVAYLDGVAAGCGGVAFLDGFAEVKRMFASPAGRGRGVARALLNRIEAEAAAAGFEWLRLETGNRQQAALCLYERAGFEPCKAFGPYACMAPAATATSVFMAKRLG